MRSPLAVVDTEPFAPHQKEENSDFVVDQPRTAPFKFAYSLGDTPLEGYTIKRGIGRGGFGEVYFATSDAGKEVALKLVRRNLDIEIRGVTQCLNLKHPNLISIYDLRGDQHDDQWVIMEYVSGTSLDEEISQNPNGMPEDRINWWMQGICGAVQYLHDHGIVHRDLKPGNIFSDEGIVKVGDYGLAKFISCSRRSGQTESVGTVHYMAPEIANGRYGKEIDIYALGIILFEMIVGTVPFEGESVGEILMKHLTSEPDLTRLPKPYQEIVRRALTKDPSDRLQGVDELMSLLPGVQSPPVIHAPKVGGQQAVTSAFEQRPSNAVTTPIGPKAKANGSDDPLWNAAAGLAGEVEKKWVEAPIPSWLRSVGILAVVFALIATSEFWIPILFVVFVIYGVYNAVRVSFGGDSASQNSLAMDSRNADPKKKKKGFSPFRSASLWKEQVDRQLASKSRLRKSSEYVGSMVVAAGIAAVAAWFAMLAIGELGGEQGTALYAWLVAVGTLASWAAMLPAKLIEGREEDHLPIRFMQFVLGACVGLAAWGLGQVLLIGMPYWPDFGIVPSDAVIGELIEGRSFVIDYGFASMQPSLESCVIYFALLFMAVKWWRQAEYTRKRRVALHSLASTLFLAWFIHIFWWFPQPAGLAVAMVAAISVQIASPWLPTSQRKLLEEQATAIHQPA